jgi:acyl carrier protein
MYAWLRQLLAETLRIGPESITPEMRLGELARDSLDHVELVMRLEEELEGRLPAHVAERLDVEQMTVGELAELLERYRGSDGAQ